MHPTCYYDINMEESRQVGGIACASGADYLLLLQDARLADFRRIDIGVSKISNVNRFRVRNSNRSLFERVFSVTKQFRVEIQSFSLARTVSAVSHY